MALNKPQAVPIDTHMLQVAVRHYGVKLHSKSLTHKVYTQIGMWLNEIVLKLIMSEVAIYNIKFIVFWATYSAHAQHMSNTCPTHAQPLVSLTRPYFFLISALFHGC